jgi:hypothetical protein
LTRFTSSGVDLRFLQRGLEDVDEVVPLLAGVFEDAVVLPEDAGLEGGFPEDEGDLESDPEDGDLESDADDDGLESDPDDVELELELTVSAPPKISV